MAFQKKPKVVHADTRHKKFDSLIMREEKVKALNAEKTPESRKARKRMNDVVYRGSRSNLKEWYKPTGKGVTCK